MACCALPLQHLTRNPQNYADLQDSEENKLIYTDVFNQYCTILESQLEKRLAAVIPGFDMVEFVGLVEARQEEVDPNVRRKTERQEGDEAGNHSD
jgi:hypothetical protein